MWTKKIEDGEIARKKFLSGVNKVGRYVGATMGPHGRNWILQQKFKAPQIHNDGVEVARHIFLDDIVEDLAAQTLVDIAMNTNQEAGDGTTTSIVVANALVTRGFKETELSEQTGISPVSIAEEIYQERPKVIEKLKEKAKKLKKEDLYKVVSTSLRDWTLGKQIADMLNEVGVDGRITVEDNWETKRETEFEVVKGMKFLGKVASPYFANTPNGKEAVWKDTLVLVTNEHIDSYSSLQKLVEQIKNKGKRKLVIINGHSTGNTSYSKKLVEDLVQVRLNMPNFAQRGIEVIEILPLELPSLTSDQLKDIAVCLNARFIDTNASRYCADAKLEDLGYAKDISAVNDGHIHITGGKGDVKKRIEEIKEQIKLEQDTMFQGKLRDRIASLNAAQGLIRVGAPTEGEKRYHFEKIQDAINAGRAAMEEGVIQGGGIPLKEIAEELGEGHILYEALMAPYKTIQENAGKNLEIKENILDPVKVTRLAVENALSAGAQLIATGGGIADERESLMDKLEHVIEKTLPSAKADFRADENQDLGRPTT